MLHIVESAKSLEALAADLEKAVVRNGFGVLGVHDLREAMAKKGVAFGPACRVFEVCNPHQAKKVLESDMRISTALPCRISVYDDGARRRLATILPTALIGMFEAPALQSVAREVETTLLAIMDEAAR